MLSKAVSTPGRSRLKVGDRVKVPPDKWMSPREGVGTVIIIGGRNHVYVRMDHSFLTRRVSEDLLTRL